ncbi:hypothetical protein AB0L70_18260 [Kribbella sp. NPDC051952]|uniref:hypothetical protein n=1 Tax=Kribbella sp. NPDC051952 TaxID=3154851 RepID=UPI00343E9A06
MADELEVAYRTGQVTIALADARATLDAAGRGLQADSEFGRALSQRLDDVKVLSTSVEVLKFLESNSRQARNDDERNTADMRLREGFHYVQDEAGPMIAQFGDMQQELNDLRKDLPDRAEALADGLAHLDKLEQLTGGETEETKKLRGDLTGLQNQVKLTTVTLKEIDARLDTARTAVGRFSVAELPVTDQGRHYAAASSTRHAVNNEVFAATRQANALSQHLTQVPAESAAATAARVETERAIGAGLPPRLAPGDEIVIDQTYSYSERDGHGRSSTVNEL